MRRRELLTGALAAAAGGCAAQQAGSSIEVGGAVTKLDRSLGRISDPFQGFVRRETGRSDAVIPEAERELVSGSLKSLLLLGTLRDLPRDARSHPEVQARAAALMPESGRSLYGMTMHMQQMVPAERIAMQREIARDPSLPLRAAEHLDRLAGVGELGPRSRYHLRSIATDAAWRLGHQPVSLFLDDTTARVTKAVARAGERSASEREWLAARMQEEGEWDEDSEYEYYDAPEEEEPEEPVVRRRERRPWGGRGMAIGGGAAGILGLVGGYVSFVWFAVNDYAGESLAGPTALAIVSGVTFVAGVIVMIVGLVLKSRQDREWLERNPKPRRRRR
jgi:hypothetical protein